VRSRSLSPAASAVLIAAMKRGATAPSAVRNRGRLGFGATGSTAISLMQFLPAAEIHEIPSVLCSCESEGKSETAPRIRRGP
jgi:hypothetical protein